MADETVASLGFEVNSGQIDQAKQNLSGLTTEAGKAEKAVDGLNKSFVGLGSATKGGAFGGSSNPFDAMTKGITAANTEIEKTAPKLVGMGAAINAAIGRSAVSFDQMKAGIAGANTALDAHKASIDKAAAAHVHLSSQSQAAAHSVRSLIEVIASGGSPVQALTQQFSHLSYAATGAGGLAGAFSGLTRALGPMALALGAVAGAAGVGGAILALEKLNDEVENSKSHFAGLTGSTASGAKAYDAIKAAASAAGVGMSALSGAVDAAIIGQEKFGDRNVQSVNTADALGKKATEVGQAFATFGSIMQGNRANAEQEDAALKALGSSFQNTGKLGADAFNKIRSISSETALSVANAFGYQTVQRFIAELEKAPISLDQFIRVMAQVKGRVDDTLKPQTPKNFEQALRGVTDAAHDMLEELAKAGAFDLFKNILTGTKGEIDAIGHPLDALGRKYKEIAADARKDWSEFFSITEDESSIWGGKITVDIDGAIHKVMISLHDLNVEPIKKFVDDAVGQFGRLAQSAIAAAGAAVSAFANIAALGKGGGGNAGAGGNPGSTDALGYVMGGTGGASDGLEGVQLSPQGNDAGAPGFDLGLADLPAFASGGQFTVAGSGGTDSQVVAFKSTPGEVVTVSTPEQIALQSTGAISGVTTQSQPSAVGVVSATPEPAAVASVKEITDAIDKSSIDITKKMLLGSDAIVAELKKLTGGVAASTVNPATGLPIANMIKAPNGSLVPSSVTGGSGGGGGFTAKGLNADYGAEARAMEKAFAALNGTTPNSAYSSLVTGAINHSVRGGQTSGAPNFPTMAPTGQFAAAQNPNYNPADYNSGYSTGGYGGDPYTGSYYPQADPMNSGGYDSGSSNFYGTDSGGSGDIYGSFSDIGTTQVPSGSGGVYGFDGNVDPNAINYGGGSVDAGYFATGGSFTVPGSAGGGVDKTLVVMHNTPGETVTVTPNGVTVPSVGSQSAKNDDPSSQANITNKTVNIHVQAGIQAESFIRSRAQIARGF